MRKKRSEPDDNPAKRFKHIILGIDGTWQAAYSDVFHSNVYRMNAALDYEDVTSEANPQIFIYSSGLGTANRSSRYQAGALGEGLDESILQAYINLVSNYAPGDKIYIFGFSRGAVAARALTGFISHSGLLKANSASLIEHAWRYYTGKKPIIDYSAQRAENTHRLAQIEFLGLWDTVSGPFKRKELFRRYRFENLKLNSNIKHGVQILSTDDTRADFEPILWDGRSSPTQVLEQIWMPGVHADIGGGYDRSFISTLSLLVMIDKLAGCCPTLGFDRDYIENTLLPVIRTDDVVINDEWKGYWTRDIKWVVERYRSVNDVEDHRQHPILSTLLSREILVKNRKVRYSPFFRVSGGRKVLPDVSFDDRSWHARSIQAVLRNRWP